MAGATWADVDGNGRPDLIYSGATNGTRRVVIATRDGAGPYTPAALDLPEVAGPVVAEDFDRDGRNDLLLCDSSLPDRAARIYWNRMPDGFVAGPVVASNLPVTAAGTTDANGDGIPDVWLVQRTSETPPRLELSVLLQQHSQFERSFHLDSTEFLGAAAPVWGDFNHDGFPDLVAPRQDTLLRADGKETSTNYFVLYRNQGDGTFIPGEFLFGSPVYPTGRAPTFVPAAADVDLDGDLDLVGFQKELRPFYNQHPEPNVPPEMPSDLHAFVLGQELHLSWSPATDRNQTTPLTYNIRAGTKPGLGDLVPSQSLTNGVRQLPATGNAGFLLSRIIHLPRLDAEAIYWSVQAVDASFSGGAFAPEQVLEVDFPGNQPPELQAPGEVILTEDGVAGIRFTVSDDRTPPGELKLYAVSDNPDLFPESGLQIDVPPNSTSPLARNLVLRPTPNGFGTASVFLVARDRNGASTTNTISVVVRPENDAPEIRVIAPDLAYRGAPLTGILHVSDVETSPDDLKLRALSSNAELLPPTGISIQGTGGTRNLVLTPAPDRSGDVTVTVAVEDGDGAVEFRDLHLQWRDQLMAPEPLPSAMTNLVQAHWADFDGDGVLDVVGSDRSRNGLLTVWRQNPRAVFENVSEREIGFRADTILVADFDGDGDADVVASIDPNAPTSGGATVVIAWNDEGRLTRTDVLRSTTPPRFLAALDLDSDGDLDLVSADGISDLRILRHSSEGFENAWSDLPLENPADLMGGLTDPGVITGLGILDFNGDGRADLFLSRNRSSPRGRGVLILQQSSGEFLVQPPTWNSSAQFVDSADFNLDGRLDILIQDWASSGEYPSKILFSRLEQHRLETKVTYANVGDLDGNGTEDALGIPGILTGLDRASTGLLRQNSEFWGVDEPNSGDFDQDGRLDLLAQQLDALVLFRNLGIPTNQPPRPPSQLHVEQLPLGAVHLSWAAASDPDQPGGLTYNLRVGTAPGTNDIVPSLALPDGRGLVPARGNTGGSLERELRSLTPGRTYYWSVQAVDSGRSRSPFAPEQSFQVTGTPVIAEIGEVSVPLNTSQVEVPISVHDPETPTSELRIEVISLNPVMLPPDRIHLGGTPAQPLLILEPRRDRAGTATLIVRATDGDGHATERSFTFYIPSNNGHTMETFTTVDVPAGGEVTVSLNDFDRDGEFQDYRLTLNPTHGTWDVRGTQIVYRPSPKFLGEDRLEFLASTPGSWPAFGRVTLRVVPAHHIRPELRLTRTGFPKRLQIVLRSFANARLTLESSSDLIHWTPRGDHIIPSGEVLVIDPPEFTADAPHFLRANLAE
ncbi:MAG: VCBS repeat-containing protein [Verrucomicrobiales bacterium]|nr:VCBS repeat-containing protein [Verrucomicrobiales bacterium]